MKRTILLLFLLGVLLPTGFAEEKIFPPAEKPLHRMFLGEKMTFRINYLGVQVGEVTAEVKEIVKMYGRDAFHVVIEVRSAPILDWVYPVKDTHHSFIDTEYFHSLKFEKQISEGHYQTHKMMEYDQGKHLGKFYSFKDKSRKEMFIAQNAQDQVSCAYWLRLQDVKPDSKTLIPVNADEKNWDLEVVAHRVRQMTLEGVGTFQAIEVEPVIMFEGLFVRRGRIRGWLSLDERRIPLTMKVRVPVLGNVIAMLTKYEPGREATNGLKG